MIDDELYKMGYRFIRNIDDYQCFTKTKEEAEFFLIELEKNLKQFNLSLNHKKTEITKLPQATNEFWVRKLNNLFEYFKITEKEIDLGNTHLEGILNTQNTKNTIYLHHIQTFMDYAIDLMQSNQENSAILNYIVKSLSNKRMSKNATIYYIDTLHHLVLIYPYLATVLDEYVFIPHRIQQETIQNISNNLFELGKTQNISEAVCYSLYFAIKYDFKLIEDKLFNSLNEKRDCIALLLGFIYAKKHSQNIIMDQYKTLAKTLKQSSNDEYWLFIYEVLNRTDLKDHWAAMKKNKISFIDPNFI